MSLDELYASHPVLRAQIRMDLESTLVFLDRLNHGADLDAELLCLSAMTLLSIAASCQGNNGFT